MIKIRNQQTNSLSPPLKNEDERADEDLSREGIQRNEVDRDDDEQSVILTKVIRMKLVAHP
jgi:hypothetical protein